MPLVGTLEFDVVQVPLVVRSVVAVGKLGPFACLQCLVQRRVGFYEAYERIELLRFEGDGIAESPVFIGFSGLLWKVILSNEKGDVSLSD
jgi:hypothetical protein